MATLLAAGAAAGSAISALGIGGTAAVAGGALGLGGGAAAIAGSKGRKKARDAANQRGEELRSANERKATAERISSDEDLRRQRLFQAPIPEEEEIISKRKQLLGQ